MENATSWPKYNPIDTKFRIKPVGNESCKESHAEHLAPCTQSFDTSSTTDIEYIVEKSDNSHREESEEKYICLLSTPKTIVRIAHILDDERSYNHQQDYYEK
ncbi:hypothetical protein KAZ93_00665 [Patescibacteria group bacterium]|nr:hypothetical protein [Patescibacteria group bacterium]